MCSVWIQFNAVCIMISDNVSCKFYDGKLHSKAESEERNLMCSCIFDSFDLTFDTTVTESTRHEDTTYITEKFIDIFRCDSFRVNPFDIYGCVAVDAAMF